MPCNFDVFQSSEAFIDHDGTYVASGLPRVLADTKAYQVLAMQVQVAQPQRLSSLFHKL